MAVLPVVAPGCQGNLERQEYARIVMGVEARIILYGPDETTGCAAAGRAFDRLLALDTIMSDWRDDSELSELCRRAGTGPVHVSEDLFTVLERAQEVSVASDGAFDVTVGPCVRLWRQARAQGRLPDDAARAEAAGRSGWRLLHLDTATRRVTLDRPGMQLDLGGIGPGYAAGEVVEVLAEAGFDRALVDIGGDIVAGAPPPNEPGWRIAVETAGPGPAPVVHLARGAISQSGDTGQFIEIEGVRYSHIVDPATCAGLTNRLRVTVQAPDGATADALATAVSVLGAERGRALVARFPGASVRLEEEDSTRRTTE